MEYRALGRSSLKISEIGVGTEHFVRQSQDTIDQTLHLAIDAGINYFDIVYAYPSYLEAIGKVIEPMRENLILAIHIGAGAINGIHRKLRSSGSARRAFDEALSHLKIESADIAIIQNVYPKEYEKIMKSSGLISFAEELRETGQTKYIGLSSHYPQLIRKAVLTEKFDMLMSQFNLLAEEIPDRKGLVQQCYESQTAFVAIKPYAGGHLLKTGRKIRVPRLKSGGEMFEMKFPKTDHMPARCLAYVLDHEGITTVIPGFKNAQELQEALDYYIVDPQDKEYDTLVNVLKESKS
ncbi:MAG: aldo/keto reductase [Candidatus Heimdallarchaeota archaeon]